MMQRSIAISGPWSNPGVSVDGVHVSFKSLQREELFVWYRRFCTTYLVVCCDWRTKSLWVLGLAYSYLPYPIPNRHDVELHLINRPLSRKWMTLSFHIVKNLSSSFYNVRSSSSISFGQFYKIKNQLKDSNSSKKPGWRWRRAFLYPLNWKWLD